MEGLYYEHSGKFSLMGVVMAILMGSLIGCVGGFLYAYIILYCPIIYINLLLTVGFGLVMGALCASQLKRYKVRSDKVAVVVSIVVTTISYYFSWAVWLWALIRRDGGDVGLLDLLGETLQPWLVLALMARVNAIGAWTLGSSGSAVTGWGLALVWLGEAAIIYGCAVAAGYGAMDKAPFCETCDEWAKTTESVVAADVSDMAEFKRRMEAKDFHYLESAGPPKPASLVWVRLDVHSCPRCGSFHTMDGEQATVKIESGKRKESTKTVLHNLILTASEAETLRKLQQRMDVVLPPPASKAAGAS